MDMKLSRVVLVRATRRGVTGDSSVDEDQQKAVLTRQASGLQARRPSRDGLWARSAIPLTTQRDSSPGFKIAA